MKKINKMGYTLFVKFCSNYFENILTIIYDVLIV